jgi:hypothetical protein
MLNIIATALIQGQNLASSDLSGGLTGEKTENLKPLWPEGPLSVSYHRQSQSEIIHLSDTWKTRSRAL